MKAVQGFSPKTVKHPQQNLAAYDAAHLELPYFEGHAARATGPSHYMTFPFAHRLS